MNPILITVITLTAIGLLVAAILFAVAKRFKVEEDVRIDEVEALLPGANCGGCGCAGCRDFATKLVAMDEFGDAQCPVGGGETMARIAALLGKTPPVAAPKVAVVKCNGSCENRPTVNIYDGYASCKVKGSLYSGDTACRFGCLGGGDCVRACKFGAISMNPETGLPVVDESKCTGCGACTKVCPKGVIDLRAKGPRGLKVVVVCNNKDKGAVARKACKAACIGCSKCVKVCPHDAVVVEDNLAWIDPEKCKLCTKCVEECPTGAIHKFNFPVRKAAAVKEEEPAVDMPGSGSEPPPVEKNNLVARVASFVNSKVKSVFGSEFGSKISSMIGSGFVSKTSAKGAADAEPEPEEEAPKPPMRSAARFKVKPKESAAPKKEADKMPVEAPKTEIKAEAAHKPVAEVPKPAEEPVKPQAVAEKIAEVTAPAASAEPAEAPKPEPKAEETPRPAEAPKQEPKVEEAPKPAETPKPEPKAEEAPKPAEVTVETPVPEQVVEKAVKRRVKAPKPQPETEETPQPVQEDAEVPKPAPKPKRTRTTKKAKPVEESGAEPVKPAKKSEPQEASLFPESLVEAPRRTRRPLPKPIESEPVPAPGSEPKVEPKVEREPVDNDDVIELEF